MATTIAPANQDLTNPGSDFYPDSPADEGWAGDDDVLRSHALSVCANAWALVYTPLIDGPKPARTASA